VYEKADRNGFNSFRVPANDALPITYPKFVDIFFHMGIIQGQRLRVLEISAAPYGAFNALLYNQAIERFDYTQFTSEMSKPLVHSKAKNINDLFTNLGVKTVSREAPKKLKREYHLIINDIGDKRNSAKTRMLRGKGVYFGKGTEAVESSPGSRVSERMKKLRCNYALKHLLEPGGVMLVKVMEPWFYEISNVMWELFRDFRNVMVYKTPYSKSLSSEVYMAGIGYKKGEVDQEVFFRTVAEVSNIVLERMTSALTLLTERDKQAYNMIIDRSDLRIRKTLNFNVEIVTKERVPPDKKVYCPQRPASYDAFYETLWGFYDPNDALREFESDEEYYFSDYEDDTDSDPD